MWNRSPRQWQLDAFEAATTTAEPTIVHAVTGAGKTDVIRALSLWWSGPVLIAVPTVALVEQTAEAIEGATMLYGHEKGSARVVVACYNSLELYPATAGLLVIVDEAHKSERPTVLDAIKRLSPQKLVGFSATPLRSSKHEDLSLFASCCYSYPAHRAIADGVVLMPTVEAWTGRDCTVDEALDEMLRRHAGRRIMVTARDKEDAEATAARLGGLAVHCSLPRREVKRRIEMLRTGCTPCLVFVDLLAEGVDLPWLEVLALRVPIGSSVQFCQRVGRVMRSTPTKTACWILDPLDLFGCHSLTPEMALAGTREERDDTLPDLSGVVTGSMVCCTTDPMLSGIWTGSLVRCWPESRPHMVIDAEVETAIGDLGVALSTPMPFDGPIVLRARRLVPRRVVEVARAAKAERLSRAQAWLRSEVLELMATGKAPKVQARRWRKMEPTDKQVSYIERLAKTAAKRPIDAITRSALNVAWSQVRCSNRGYCSDLIEVLKHVGR
jgi:hypothetical protein